MESWKILKSSDYAGAEATTIGGFLASQQATVATTAWLADSQVYWNLKAGAVMSLIPGFPDPLQL